MYRLLALLLGPSFLLTALAADDSIEVTMHLLTSTGVGKDIGKIKVEPSKFGTIFTPDLTDLTPGIHGVHVHQNPDCGPAEKDGKTVPGLAAGGHYDPDGAGHHAGPYGDGHLGDLPALYVDAEGTATQPVLAPRIRISDLKGHSLMIHAGGDNYSDHPKKLGGGGARMACGIVK